MTAGIFYPFICIPFYFSFKFCVTDFDPLFYPFFFAGSPSLFIGLAGKTLSLSLCLTILVFIWVLLLLYIFLSSFLWRWGWLAIMEGLPQSDSGLSQLVWTCMKILRFRERVFIKGKRWESAYFKWLFFSLLKKSFLLFYFSVLRSLKYSFDKS